MTSKGRFQPLLLIIAALLLYPLSACSTSPSGPPASATSTPNIGSLGPGLHVIGNQIMTHTGPLVFHGVDRSGAEYHCTQKGKSTFDGPSDQASINAMLAWKINIVRVPLNEDCWLGINGEPANGTTATRYQQDVVNFVHLLRQNNLVVILDLHWTAPGKGQALAQMSMPDADHASAFWSSVAGTFKDDPFIIFDLFNEPYINSWQCWLYGNTQSRFCKFAGFPVAGMQTLVNAVRNAGANNLIMLGGLSYSNDVSAWIQFKPTDPKNNLVVSFHMYENNGCSSIDCLNREIAPVAARYPIIMGEIGEFDCTSNFLNTVMPWLDSHKISYLAWAWDTYDCGAFPSLVSDYKGTPTGYGLGFKNHLAALAG